MSTWSDASIAERVDWAEGLWSLRLDVTLDDFDPGQWVNLGIEVQGELIKRSYSLASAPGAPAELFLVLVETGALTPRLHALRRGDRLRIDTKPQGFFTLSYVPDARDLWLVATGTGLSPYLSMLDSDQVWRRFERVVVVYGARHTAQLAYGARLDALAAAHPGHFDVIRSVTREHSDDALFGRIPALIESGELEAAAGHTLDAEHSHVMLCGNPGMIRDCTDTLATRGLRKHRVRKPGHISTGKILVARYAGASSTDQPWNEHGVAALPTAVVAQLGK